MRELLEQALDALIVLLDEWTPAREAQLKGIATIAALREALAAAIIVRALEVRHHE